MFFDLREARLSRPSLLNAIVAPRPIAWVSTLNEDGVVNLAPFSYFNLLTNSPPTVVLSCVNATDRPAKDTLRNIRRSGEFTISMVSRELLEVMHQSSAPMPFGVSEIDALGIDATPSTNVRPPRVRAAPAALECTLLQEIAVPAERPGDLGCTALVARIVGLYIAPHLLDDAQRFRTVDAHLVARIGGNFYAELGPLTEIASVAKGS